MNLGEVVLYNLFYEFSDFCTSIITEDYTGTLYHVRNLDFGLFFWSVYKDGGGIVGILKWILGDRNESWLGFLTRSVLEKATSFTQAKVMLENTGMLSPAYFILGGNKSGEGVVITRDRDRDVDTWTMRNASQLVHLTNQLRPLESAPNYR
ncbi:Acid ceramidase [Bulinus truncatus]|nr:Acid ceramidase [Bulinus truncatus]